MLRRILLASAGAMALAGTAFAADLPTHAPPPVYVAPVFSWTGFYVGGQLGYAWGKDNGNVYSILNETGLDTIIGVFDSFSSTQSQLSPSGAIGGAHIGYNWQINQFVLGVEANVDATNYHAQQNIFSVASFPDGSSDIGLFNNQIRSTIQGAFRGRVGWAWNNWLFYGTGGVAFTDATTQYRTGGIYSVSSIFPNFPLASLPIGFDSRTRELVGWTAGGGIQYAFTPNWIFGVEYRYSDFGKFTDRGLFGTGFASFVGPFGSTYSDVSERHHLTENQVQARVSYKFDWLAPVPVVAKY